MRCKSIPNHSLASNSPQFEILVPSTGELSLDLNMMLVLIVNSIPIQQTAFIPQSDLVRGFSSSVTKTEDIPARAR